MEAAADVLSLSSELQRKTDFKDVYVNPDRTLEELTERRKLVDLLKKKISSEPTKYHYIKNGTICTVDKRPETRTKNLHVLVSRN